ncbi:MAG TPA: hypothetical protein VJ853_12645, partial [Thermoanaerobaculia bacterium]|nr:hypothetical protein [Thermoanaerobaculia bacterium]
MCAVLFSALLAVSAAAQSADLTLKLSVDDRYNAGETATLRATVTNLGPDTASNAGVRLTKPSAHFANAAAFGCIEFSDSILCNTPAIAAGESHDFTVPFVSPDDAATVQLSARTESFSLDPNHDNDAASATMNVVKLADLSVEAAVYPSLRVGQASTFFVTIRQHAALRIDPVTFTAKFPAPLQVDVPSNCTSVDSSTIRCTLKTLGSDIATQFDVTPAADAAPVPVTVAIQSDNDWNPADNRVSLSLPIYNVPNLDIHITSPDALDDSNRTVATYTFTNPTDLPTTNVEAEIITAPGNPDPVLPSDWVCAPSATYRLKCDNPLIGPHSSSTLQINVQFDRQYIRGTFATNVTLKPAPDALIPVESLFADAVFYKP